MLVTNFFQTESDAAIVDSSPELNDRQGFHNLYENLELSLVCQPFIAITSNTLPSDLNDHSMKT